MTQSDIAVRRVETKADFRQFIRLPREIYAGMPGFSPRLDMEQAGLLDKKKAPFFTHGRAEYWLAFRGGRPVGRISAQIDDLVAEYQDEPYGMFGCLDAVDSAAVVGALAAAAEAWLKAEGQSLVRGPFSPTIIDECGLLVEGQDAPASTMLNWAPAYLAGHLAAHGYGVAKKLVNYRMALSQNRDHDHAGALRKRRRPADLTLRALDRKRLAADGELIRQIYNDAWAGNWGFVPITEAEMSHTVKELGPLLLDGWGVFAEYRGETVGCALIVPNLAEISADLGGRLLPFQWVQFLFSAMRRRYRSGRVILLGVRSATRGTILAASLPLIMIDELFNRSHAWSFVDIEMGWVLEDNRAIAAIIERVGGKVDRTFALFEKAL